jgi:adenosylmethionine-8-amino-7-oxononanoate aminotransferase
MNDLQKADKENIWHPFTPLRDAENPLLIKSASGVYLHTHDGRKIIDAVSSWWVNLHGHANPVLANAIAKQAGVLEHVIFAGFTHEPAISLSENLLKILPGNQRKIFFSDNGSTAVEVALKMAFQYWYNKGLKNKNVVAIKGAYHGDTFGSMSVGDRGLFTDPFSSYLFQTSFIDFPKDGHEENSMEQFKTLVKTNRIGVFIFEPLLQGAAGMRIYSPEILDHMIAYAQANDIICIADEVLTGFGRTGKNFASDYLKNKPDIIALSKGLTGGMLPLGVTACSDKITEPFETTDFTKTFFHGHSYTANPMACAVANASYALLFENECQASIKRISLQQQNFRDRMGDHSKLRSIKSLGTIVSLELDTTTATSYTSNARKKIYDYFLEKNILLRPLGNVIYILPPYVITNEELAHVHTTIEDFLQEF